MTETKLDLLQGTLDLLVLQTLASMGSLHGYGTARRIEQTRGNRLVEHGIERRTQPRGLRAIRLEPFGERRILRHGHLDHGTPVVGETTVDEGHQIRIRDSRLVHLTTCKRVDNVVPSIATRSLSRARESRDMTVPIGSSSALATSW